MRIARLVLLVVLIAACGGFRVPVVATGEPSSAPATPTPAAPPTASSTEASPELIEVSGEGIMESETFDLAGGDYRTEWTATPRSDGGCFHGLSLARADGDFFGGTIALVTLDSREPRADTSFVHGVPAGRYYINASSGCKWTVKITRE